MKHLFSFAVLVLVAIPLMVLLVGAFNPPLWGLLLAAPLGFAISYLAELCWEWLLGDEEDEEELF